MNDMKKMLCDLNVPAIESGASVTKGWLGLNCPYCSDTHFHLGYNIRSGIFSCWKCGKQPFMKTLILLTGKSKEELNAMLSDYYIPDEQEELEAKPRPLELVLPREFERMTSRHKRYLKGRGYDWRELEKTWGLLGVEDEGIYANRIIIPIYFKKKLVSFTSRDITGKSKLKAMVCPKDQEVVHAKDLLHGFDLVKGNTVVVMEGAFDSFRYGVGSVNTQGIAFTDNQVELLGAFRNIFICFDSIINDNGFEAEKKAQEQAEKLADSLSVRSNVWILDEFESDPGDMSEKQIQEIKYTIQNTIKNLKED